MNCPNRVDFALAADPAHIATARRQVTANLRCWNLDHMADDAALITSELVTNAVLYGRTETVTVRLAECGTPADPQLLITVTDESPAQPVPEATSPAAVEEHGRGLHILQCLASCWGTIAKPCGGKVVWATLAVSGSGHSDRSGHVSSPCCAGSRLALAFL
ncbi:anti-sigma regulatory factor (Ser/Thr protein kinase) [Streptomyces sp. V4I23]|uniref:ATP-binding protein n=1 Tax=Streptomyces sp. V4I23 TaxID=3042282 RepID=UPI002785A240|nr:ATP-binding protein [Streptomyces sp. V4I23]MDQ1012439.1 anti-sigma regulatory factor (Ser/Thr protein kinase) [Streptomyces sp. V4I23]